MKVGDYVRTENGLIGKIIGFKGDMVETDNKRLITYKSNHNEIIKSSPNIIDLIEEGDYINGLRVEKNKYGELYTSYVYYGGNIGKQCEVYTTWLKEYKENEDYINTILTKEQFESMEYKL